LGLAGEAGEVANKVKKLIRDGPDKRPETWREDIASEIGDVLWYCAALATDLNLTLGMIAGQNEAKLSARKTAGTIGGSGDTR
jgi:NTP pyrophosphatase (non-canonical NTP hydrolase)